MFWLIMAAAIAADQISKYLIVQNLAVGESIPLLGDFLHFTHVVNEGASFSMLQGQRGIFLVLTVIVLVAVIWLYLKKVPRDYKLFTAMLGLFCGGTIGNLIDRIYQSGVTDFLDLGWFPVFNIADCCICVSVIFICVMLLFGKAGKMIDSKKVKKQK